MTSKHSVLDCYYRDFGNFKTCPNSSEHLFATWERCINSYFSYDLSQTKIKDCNRCTNGIYLRDKKVRCKTCLTYMHLTCLPINCPHCSLCHMELFPNNLILNSKLNAKF